MTPDVYPLAAAEHLLVLLGVVRDLADRLAFDRAKVFELDLSLREIGTNAYRHGGGGSASVRAVGTAGTPGIEVTIVDRGPGIRNVDAALVDGFSTVGGLGLGLGAARRLSDALEIDSPQGGGTRVRLVKWATTRNATAFVGAV